MRTDYSQTLIHEKPLLQAVKKGVYRLFRMAATRLVERRNFRQVDTRLLTAGQPNEAQLADAAGQGVEVVINVALTMTRAIRSVREPDDVWKNFIETALRNAATTSSTPLISG